MPQLNPLLIITFLFFFGYEGFSQIDQGGKPYSFSKEFKNSKANATNEIIPVITVPVPNLQEVYYEDSVNGWSERDGVHMPLSKIVTLTNSGHWIDLDNGDRLWSVKFQSTNAKGLAPDFENFELPKGSKLFIYSCDKKQTLGAYTSENNLKSRVFYTVPIKGNCFILEYFEPIKVKGKGTFEIKRVTYVYK